MGNQYTIAFLESEFNGAKSKYRKWCPNGCGKSVTRYPSGKAVRPEYKCERCNEWFCKKEVL